MATKTIKAWIDGAIQEIEVEDIVSPELPLSPEERLDILEDKHNVIITEGNFLVGNGTEEMEEITPEEVLSHINGASVATMTTEEFEALEETNANTLYMLTDEEDEVASPDWNAAEGEAGHVLNRTHWIERGEELLPETEFAYYEAMNAFTHTQKIELIEGETYVVIYNGQEYKCVCKSAMFNNFPLLALGNLVSVGGEDTGEPFSFGLYSDEVAEQFGGIYLGVFALDGAESVNMAVYEAKYHKLNNKFLNLEWIPTSKEIFTTLHTDSLEVPATGSCECPLSFNIEKGKKYIVTWNGTEYTCLGCSGGSDMVWLWLGNTYLNTSSKQWGYGEDTGEPFLFEVITYQGNIVSSNVRTLNSDENVELKIEGMGTAPIKMPVRFLPDGIPYMEENVLLQKTDASSFTHPSFGTMWAIYGGTPKLTVGETYTVTYNGTAYKCVCQAAPSGLIDDPNAVAMGNFSPVGGVNTGEPFAMLVSSEYGEVDIIDLAESDAVTVKIHKNVVEKLAEELLPESVDGVVIRSSTEGSTKKFKLTVDDSGTISVTEITT